MGWTSRASPEEVAFALVRQRTRPKRKFPIFSGTQLGFFLNMSGMKSSAESEEMETVLRKTGKYWSNCHREGMKGWRKEIRMGHHTEGQSHTCARDPTRAEHMHILQILHIDEALCAGS